MQNLTNLALSFRKMTLKEQPTKKKPKKLDLLKSEFIWYMGSLYVFDREFYLNKYKNSDNEVGEACAKSHLKHGFLNCFFSYASY